MKNLTNIRQPIFSFYYFVLNKKSDIKIIPVKKKNPSIPTQQSFLDLSFNSLALFLNIDVLPDEILIVVAALSISAQPPIDFRITKAIREVVEKNKRSTKNPFSEEEKKNTRTNPYIFFDSFIIRIQLQGCMSKIPQLGMNTVTTTILNKFAILLSIF